MVFFRFVNNDIASDLEKFPTNGSIDLNKVSYLFRVGRAIYSQPLHLHDPNTKTLTDFTTRFSFTINKVNDNDTNYGDGFTFYLASVGYQIPPNSAGGVFGIFNATTNNNLPQNYVVAVVLITYVSSSRTLSVFWSFIEGLLQGDKNSSLVYQIDLMEVLPEWVNIIHSWEFSSSLNSTGEFVDGISNKEGGNSNNIVIVVAAVVPIVLIILVASVIGWFIMKRKRRNLGEESGLIISEKFDLDKSAIPRRFELVKISKPWREEEEEDSGINNINKRDVA